MGSAAVSETVKSTELRRALDPHLLSAKRDDRPFAAPSSGLRTNLELAVRPKMKQFRYPKKREPCPSNVT